MVIWIVGLPGSGKTTLAKALHKRLMEQKIASIHIDGDDMRSIWGDDIGYSIEDREKNSFRIQKLCSIFEKQGLFVIASINSIFQEHREKNREIYKKYFEIFLDINMKILKKRRVLYSLKKDVVGVDIEYKKPIGYDMKIEDSIDVLQMVDDVVKEIGLENV